MGGRLAVGYYSASLRKRVVAIKLDLVLHYETYVGAYIIVYVREHRKPFLARTSRRGDADSSETGID